MQEILVFMDLPLLILEKVIVFSMQQERNLKLYTLQELQKKKRVLFAYMKRKDTI